MDHQAAGATPNLTARHPWLILTRTFSVATAIHIMLLALVGGLAMTAGWRLAANVLSQETLDSQPMIRADAEYFGAWPGERIAPARPLDGTPIMTRFWETTGYPPDDPIRGIASRITIPVVRFLDLRHSGFTLLYYVLGLVWTLWVWSYFGCAICRMAAMALAREERVELRDALIYARGRFLSCFGAYFVPIVGVVTLAGPIALLGLLMRLDVGVVFGGVVWQAVVTFSFMIVLLVFGLVLGWPLMWAAIATENTGAFDAVSRGYAYAYQRPVRYFAYTMMAILFGMLGWLVLWGISEGLINIGSWAASIGAGRDRIVELQAIALDPEAPVSMRWVGSELIAFWNLLIRTIASTYAYSYFFTAATAIYLVLRHDVDGTNLESIYMDDLPSNGNSEADQFSSASGGNADGTSKLARENGSGGSVERSVSEPSA